MEQRKVSFSVNRAAPRDGKLFVYFKKVCGSKSDGFAAWCNGEVFVIDAGLKKDEGMHSFLLSLREKWLSAARVSDQEKEEARLLIHWIVSHPHPDHIGAIPAILEDPRFCVVQFFAPARSHLSGLVSPPLPPLSKYEDKMDEIGGQLVAFGHVAENIVSIPYGTAHSICAAESDMVLDIYPAPFDWSTDRESESEGIGYLKNYTSPTYQANPEAGLANGIANGNSMWVKITKGGRSVLITGDQRASDEMLGSMIRFYGEETFSCDVLKLPHHGQKNYPPDLLSAAKPKIAVFTTAKERATPETVALCESMCDAYYLGEKSLMLTIDSESGISAEQLDF